MNTSTAEVMSAKVVDDNKSLQMDPKLQLSILLHRNGAKREATASATADEIAVIAMVTERDAWSDLTEVRAPQFITTLTGTNEHIVTGRIPITRIEFVRTQPFVLSMRAARKLKPALSSTVPDISATFQVNGKPVTGGRGVLVGIVDTGCDFAHKNFIKNKKSRIVQFWDQTNRKTTTGNRQGKIYAAADLTRAITQKDPYGALGYRPGIESHGTHVMDIATGNGAGTGLPGVAPEADIIFVQLDSTDIPWTGPDTVEKNFGDSVNLIEAVTYIFEQAGDQPCVINISLGTNGGPHDGSTLVEKAMDSLVTQKPNRCIVVAASNSYTDNIHFMGNVPGAGSIDLAWTIPGSPAGDNEMEIWYSGKERLSVEVIDPAGKNYGVIDPGEGTSENDSNGNLMLFIKNRLNDTGNNDNVIAIWAKDKKDGQWTVRLSNKSADAVPFHAWIEREDGAQSNFGTTGDANYTLGSVSCSHKGISVGSYDAHTRNSPISYFSSAGPTRDNRQKPEISAPGQAVIAANSESFDGTTIKSGTSMASPAVTGSVALLYANALLNKTNLSIDEVRTIIEKGGRIGPPAKIWDNRFGFGRISVPQLMGIPVNTSLNSAAKPKKKVKKLEKKKDRKLKSRPNKQS